MRIQDIPNQLDREHIMRAVRRNSPKTYRRKNGFRMPMEWPPEAIDESFYWVDPDYRAVYGPPERRRK
jgi:hypothetical protein